MPECPAELPIMWSSITRREWDGDPSAYIRAGLVGWGRSRRLGKLDDPARRVKAYLGVQHFDPAQWGVPGDPSAKFFLSLFLSGRTVALQTYPTLDAALDALRLFHASLPSPALAQPAQPAESATGHE